MESKEKFITIINAHLIHDGLKIVSTESYIVPLTFELQMIDSEWVDHAVLQPSNDFIYLIKDIGKYLFKDKELSFNNTKCVFWFI